LLAGPVLLAERRSGQILMLLGALFAMGMPALHFSLGADLNKVRADLQNASFPGKEAVKRTF